MNQNNSKCSNNSQNTPENSLSKLHVHLIGVGGVAMYSLARMSLERGAFVTGTDRSDGKYLRDLASRGAAVTVGGSALPPDADLVVYSLAIPENDPALTEARRRDLPTLSRAGYQGRLLASYPTRVAVAGSHGKSTVTAMLAAIFCAAGREPTVLCGAELSSGLPYLPGGRETVIYEACEYRRSFLEMPPTDAIITNVEWDHTDCYPDFPAVVAAFRAFADSADRVYAAADLFSNAERPVVRSVDSGRACRSFVLCDGDLELPISLAVPGGFQVTNASLAALLSIRSGIPAATVADALASFRGIGRRLEPIGRLGASSVYYDYAHHPTEIAAGIATLRELTGQPVTVVFRPHTFTRTRDLFDGFAAALSTADRVLLTEIFAAREEPIPGVTSAALAAAIGAKAVCLPQEQIAALLPSLSPSTVVLMGAGDLSEIIRVLPIKR